MANAQQEYVQVAIHKEGDRALVFCLVGGWHPDQLLEVLYGS
jgi:hypothetical protein